MKLAHYSILACVLMILFAGCTSKQNGADASENTENSAERPCDDGFVLDLDGVLMYKDGFYTPDNIVEYVSYMISEGLADFENRHEGINADMMALAQELQAYKDGTQKVFPGQHLREVLSKLLRIEAVIEDHLSYDHEAWRGLLLVPRLLEFAASICSDINYMADVCSDDHRVGVMNIESGYNSYYQYAFIIAQGEQNFTMHYMPESQRTIRHIRKLTPRNDDERNYFGNYYLLTTEEGLTSNSIVLFRLNENIYSDIYDLTHDADFVGWQSEYQDGYTIYFNPKELCWSYCRMNKYGNLEQVDGTQRLYLNVTSKRVELHDWE